MSSKKSTSAPAPQVSPTQPASAAGTAVQLRAALQGRDFGSQSDLLSPRDGAPAPVQQKARAGAEPIVVQRSEGRHISRSVVGDPVQMDTSPQTPKVPGETPAQDAQPGNDHELSQEALDKRAAELVAKANAEMAENHAETVRLTAEIFAGDYYKSPGRVVIGDGFAAVSVVATLPEVVSGGGHSVIGVGFKGEPWINRGTLAMGQAPHLLDVPGFVTRPWAYRDNKDEQKQKYLQSEHFGLAIAQTQRAIKLPIARGFASGMQEYADILALPDATPEQAAQRDKQITAWQHKDRKYRFLLEDEGRITEVYTDFVDVCSGPGPGRMLATRDLRDRDTGEVNQKQQITKEDAEVLGKDAPGQQYPAYVSGNDYSKVAVGGTVVVYGASPSGAWAAQYAKHAGAANVIWVGATRYMPMTLDDGPKNVRGWPSKEEQKKDPEMAKKAKAFEELYLKLQADGNAPWIATYIGDRNKEAIQGFAKGNLRGYGRFEANLTNAAAIAAPPPAQGSPAPTTPVVGAGPSRLNVGFDGAPGTIPAHQLVVCAGADTEAKGGIANLAVNTTDPKGGEARFDYVPIFGGIDHAEIVASTELEKDGGGWWTKFDRSQTGPPLGLTDRGGGVRVLGAAACNLANGMGKRGAEYLKRLWLFLNEMPPEMQTPDGIGLHGFTVTEANKKGEGGKATQKDPITPNSKPKNRTELISLNVAPAEELERVPVLAQAFRFQPAFHNPALKTAAGSYATVIAQVRSGQLGIVVTELDKFESDKQNERIERNKIDGFGSVNDLYRFRIITAERLAPYAEWLRV